MTASLFKKYTAENNQVFNITLSLDNFDGEFLWQGTTNTFPDLVVYGDTINEADDLLKDAIETTIKTLKD